MNIELSIALTAVLPENRSVTLYIQAVTNNEVSP